MRQQEQQIHPDVDESKRPDPDGRERTDLHDQEHPDLDGADRSDGPDPVTEHRPDADWEAAGDPPLHHAAPESRAVGVARPATEEPGILSAGHPAAIDADQPDGTVLDSRDAVLDARSPVLDPQQRPESPPTGVGALMPAEAVEAFRDRWREVQLRFVDDPRSAAADARQLADEVIESITAALAAQRDALDGGDRGEDGSGENGDTERLRVAVRRYRDLVDQLLAR